MAGNEFDAPFEEMYLLLKTIGDSDQRGCHVSLLKGNFEIFDVTWKRDFRIATLFFCAVHFVGGLVNLPPPTYLPPYHPGNKDFLMFGLLKEIAMVLISPNYSKWWFQISFIFTPNLGEDGTQVDEHIFQMG